LLHSRIGLVVLFALIAASGPDSFAKDSKTVSMKEWSGGPIRYIAEPGEIKAFKRLPDDRERSLFIQRFWARRDPSPDSLTNEYRQLFWERVQACNDLFLDSHHPGWKTDRGKIYVLYGPPTRIEEHHDLDTQSGPTAGHGLIRWFYEGRPGGRVDMDPLVIVPFVRQTTGEYRLSYDPRLTSVFFDSLALEERRDLAFSNYLQVSGAGRESELAVMLDLGRMQEVPPEAQVLLERVETIETYSTHPVDVSISRYWHPDESNVVAVVTVDLTGASEKMAPAVIARIRSREAGQDPRMLGEDSFRIATTPDQLRVAQGRLVLEPGSYDLTVLVADPVTAQTGIHRGTFSVPPNAERLRLSDVTWAQEIAPVEYPSLASHDEPFHVGPFRVVPRISEEFRQGDTIKLFYEVYGGTPPYQVAYQVEGADLDGSWVALGRPASASQTGSGQAWELPTSSAWPAGQYRIRIEVADSEQRLVISHHPFSLTEGG
jgi:GWxTD domain-containing protein